MPPGNRSRVTTPAPAFTARLWWAPRRSRARLSEPPPMSIISRRPASHPYQRRAARNVRRASSSPESTVTRWPMISSDAVQDLVPFGASCIADVASAGSARPCIIRRAASRRRRRRARVDCLFLDAAVVFEMVHEPHGGLRARLRFGARADGRVDDGMCTVFDPMSSTPKRVDCSFRFAMGFLLCGCSSVLPRAGEPMHEGAEPRQSFA